MGQRLLQLNATYSGNLDNNTATLHVSQLPPNPAIFAPGPALLFVVVKGVPSVGSAVMVGSGQLGTQEVLPVADLPVSSTFQSTQDTGSSTGSTRKSGASGIRVGAWRPWFVALSVLMTVLFRCIPP